MKDNDSHKYLIPEDTVDRWIELMEAINGCAWGSAEWYAANAALDNEFGQYMVG